MLWDGTSCKAISNVGRCGTGLTDRDSRVKPSFATETSGKTSEQLNIRSQCHLSESRHGLKDRQVRHAATRWQCNAGRDTGRCLCSDCGVTAQLRSCSPCRTLLLLLPRLVSFFLLAGSKLLGNRFEVDKRWPVSGRQALTNSVEPRAAVAKSPIGLFWIRRYRLHPHLRVDQSAAGTRCRWAEPLCFYVVLRTRRYKNGFRAARCRRKLSLFFPVGGVRSPAWTWVIDTASQGSVSTDHTPKIRLV